MIEPELARPRYREGQRLGRDDLVAEQDYLIATRRRHDINGHGWGIAHGLGLSAGTAGITIDPGLAVDGYGRALIVPEPIRLRWADLPSDVSALDLWLWHQEKTTVDRVTEEVCVQILRVERTSAVRHAALADSEIDGAATRSGAAADSPYWPVYLGRLVAGDGGTPPYVPAPSRLSYPIAVAETVTAPSGVAMNLDADPLLAVDVPNGEGIPARRLEVTTDRGTSIIGSAVTAGAVLAPGEPLRFVAPVAAPEHAWPWRWYHAQTRVEGAITGNALRIEMGEPATTDIPEWYRFAVVSTSDSPQVAPPPQPPLAVDAGGTTTIGGTLTVRGPLVRAPLGDDPDDARLQDKLLGTWVDSVDAASRAVDARFSGGLVDSSALSVALSLANPPATDNPRTLHYQLTVTNTGRAPVTNMSVFTAITVNGTRSTETPVKGEQLAASGQLSRSLTVVISRGAHVHVAATALGVLSGGRVGYGSGELDYLDPPIIG